MDGLLDWIRRARLRRRARSLLETTLRDPRKLAGTSLRPRHAGRAVLVDFVEEDGEIRSIRFGVLRHPRPYAFSRQSHEVLEYWSWDATTDRFERLQGVNLTRRSGKDASDGSR